MSGKNYKLPVASGTLTITEDTKAVKLKKFLYKNKVSAIVLTWNFLTGYNNQNNKEKIYKVIKQSGVAVKLAKDIKEKNKEGVKTILKRYDIQIS